MAEAIPEGAVRVSARWRELLAYRELLWTLALREIQVRYRQAILGAAWAIIQPAALMVVFTIFFGRVLRVPSDGLPYPLFAYCALVPWSFFATSLSAGVPSLTNHAHLVTKIYFPREVLPLSSIVAAGVDFGVAACVFVGLLVFYCVPVTPAVLYAPLLVLLQAVFTAAVVLFLSALNVTYRDVRHAVPLMVQVWMFATPIIYPLSIVPERMRPLYLLNPMAGIVDGYRRVVLHGTAPDLQAVVLAAGVSVVLGVLGYRYFIWSASRFADIL
jgi:lipopolysaccharide transport system permease protein